MRFRKLRIGWSVMWGVAAVLFVVLWVRSYSRVDAVYVACVARWHCAISRQGTIYIDSGLSWTGSATYHKFEWPGFEWMVFKNDPEVDVKVGNVAFPVARLVLLTAACAPLSWISRRFRLRALLIAMTLIAVMLGFAVWAWR
jgi:hypothetical protein